MGIRVTRRDPVGKTLYQLPVTLQALDNIQHRFLSVNYFGEHRKQEFWPLLEYRYEFHSTFSS